MMKHGGMMIQSTAFHSIHTPANQGNRLCSFRLGHARISGNQCICTQIKIKPSGFFKTIMARIIGAVQTVDVGNGIA